MTTTKGRDRLSTGMDAITATEQEIADDRAEHRRHDYGNIENELDIEHLKHTNSGADVSETGSHLRATHRLSAAAKAVKIQIRCDRTESNTPVTVKMKISPGSRGKIDKLSREFVHILVQRKAVCIFLMQCKNNNNNMQKPASGEKRQRTDSYNEIYRSFGV